MAARSESHSNKWLDAIRAVWRISKQAQQARLKSHREGIGAQKPALLPRKPVVELERPDRYDHSRISEALHVLKQFVAPRVDRKSTRLNSSHLGISYAVFCLKNDTATTEIYTLSLHDALPI